MIFDKRPSLNDRSQIFFSQGDRFRDNQDWTSAVYSYKKGLEVNPGSFPIWIQLGHVLKEAGDLAGARQAYFRALEIHPKDADLQVQLGHLHTRSGDAEQARQHYAAAAKLGSTDEHALQHILPTHPAPTSALETQPLLQRDVTENSSAETFRKADLLRDERRWAEAAAMYAQGLARDPTAFGMWVQMGHMLKEAGRPLDSEKAYNNALRLSPDNADLMLQMGHLYAVLGNSSRACMFYMRSIDLGVRDRDAISYLSRYPGQEKIVLKVVARLLPHADRWRAAETDTIPDTFSRLILNIAE